MVQYAAGVKLAVARKEAGCLLTIPAADAAATRSSRFEIATGLKDKDGNPVAHL